MKNNEMAKILGQAENTLRIRASQVEDGRWEAKAMKNENNNINEINNRLEEDIEFCKRHL